MKPQRSVFTSSAWPLAMVMCALVSVSLIGCKGHSPGGAPINPRILGTVVDQVNRQQEENAEMAKFIVYMHEFEINMPLQSPNAQRHGDQPVDRFEFKTDQRVRGVRLTPAGQDHVRQIAHQLLFSNYNSDETGNPFADPPVVIVERSDTSKYWRTFHRYPVHYNHELDQARRRLVIDALLAFGIPNAEERVVIAPAFPEGLNAEDAAAAYQNSFSINGNGALDGIYSGGPFMQTGGN